LPDTKMGSPLLLSNRLEPVSKSHRTLHPDAVL
jgi:hypothetical protein